MSMDEPQRSENRLLASLARESLESLQDHLEPIGLPVGYRCTTAGRPIENVYFPTRGLIARNVCKDGAACIDAGLYGRDGFSGIPLVFGIDRSPHEDVVQIAGAALRASVDGVNELVERDTSFRSLLLRFAHCLSLQASCSALSNRTEDMIHRLSRLLLMCHDRADGPDLCLTHGFLATTLGVRRASVTSAMHHLEGGHMIKATRGRVQVRDRPALQSLAGAGYGAAEREYDRLIHPARRPETAE